MSLRFDWSRNIDGEQRATAGPAIIRHGQDGSVDARGTVTMGGDRSTCRLRVDVRKVPEIPDDETIRVIRLRRIEVYGGARLGLRVLGKPRGERSIGNGRLIPWIDPGGR